MVLFFVSVFCISCVWMQRVSEVERRFCHAEYKIRERMAGRLDTNIT